MLISGPDSSNHEELKASLFNVLRAIHAENSQGEPDNVELDRLATRFSFAVVEALRIIKEEENGRAKET
jgi:hypothetical protein